jgi:hypothetical protein
MSEKNQNDLSVFQDSNSFEMAQRAAKLLSSSKLIPTNFQNNLPDCLIALEMANRIGTSPLAVMQNLYIVHGKPGWSSQFLISALNASGKFSSLRYEMSGKDDDYGCVAVATDSYGNKLDSPRVTIGMAKKEGWFGKTGSKWQSMPELMLRYRAATLFVRLYAPELMSGFHCADEIIDVTPEPVKTSRFEKAAVAFEVKEDKPFLNYKMVDKQDLLI